MTDVFSLKLAIYFVLPPVALCSLAYVFGLVLTLSSQLVVEREVSCDTAMHAMAVVITSTAGVATLIYWTTQVLWIALAGGSASFFIVGAIVYSRLIKDFSHRGRGGFLAPIGLLKGSLISAIVSSCFVLSTLLVIWSAGGVW